MIEIPSTQYQYISKDKKFVVDGRSVQFGTRYKLINKKTQGEMVFDISHSTGSEWDPKTKWIYNSECGEYTLELGNQDVTPAHAQAYLDAKLRNM